jgi:putative addiction module killer protein
LTTFVICGREPAFKPGLSGSPLGIQETSKPAGEGVSELRIDYGPGYRVYFKRRGRTLIILLAGGDKSSQAKDIKVALRLARDLSE